MKPNKAVEKEYRTLGINLMIICATIGATLVLGVVLSGTIGLVFLGLGIYYIIKANKLRDAIEMQKQKKGGS